MHYADEVAQKLRDDWQHCVDERQRLHREIEEQAQPLREQIQNLVDRENQIRSLLDEMGELYDEPVFTWPN